MNRLSGGSQSLYRLAVLLAFATLSAAVAGGALAAPSVSSNASFESRFDGMPEPEAFDAPTASFTIGATTVRLQGVQKVHRINARTGKIIRQRRVNFGRASVFPARDTVRTFGARPYVKLLGGRYAGWWVSAPETTLGAPAALAASTHVQLTPGKHVGVRFYADGAVKVRRSVFVSAPTSFPASSQATYRGQTFYYLTEGPLADRWVSARTASVVTASNSDSTTAAPSAAPTQNPTPSPTPVPSPTTAPPPSPAATAEATWKTLVLVYRETDVTFTRADGTEYRLRARMTDTMHDLLLDTLDRTRRSVRTWSGGLAAMDMTVVDVPHPVTSLDKLSSSYWVGPRSVRPDIDQYAPPGTYDSIFVVWQAKDDAGEKVPVGGWGLTLPPGSWANGAGYSSVITPSQMWWWTSSTAPEEVFIHEWMHEVIFFHQDAGRIDLDLHAGGTYGYQQVDGTWKRWLSDVMQGTVKDGNRLLGVSADIWEAGTPTSP